MVADWIEIIGPFNFGIKHRGGKKMPHADCLSRISTEDEDQTVLVNAITLLQQTQNKMSCLLESYWQLHKLQRIKMRYLHQSKTLLKEKYPLVINYIRT